MLLQDLRREGPLRNAGRARHLPQDDEAHWTHSSSWAGGRGGAWGRARREWKVDVRGLSCVLDRDVRCTAFVLSVHFPLPPSLLT